MDPSRIKEFGLTQVYQSPEKPLVDIVFVHGLNGHPHRTWTSKTTSTFWPVDLLPQVLPSQVRILTYGYNANVTAFTDGVSNDRILNHSETLAAQLAANRTLKRCSDRPIIFVCHSLGGLVVKRALIYSRSITNEKIEHLRSIYVSTYGILFLGTPHNGSDVAKWGLLLQNICTAVLPKKFIETSPHLVKALRTNNETLQNINGLFTDIIPRFHIYFFHETLSTDVKGTRELIVDETSAAPYADGVERMGIEADHIHMCKFDDENSPGYEAVAEALLRYSQDAPTTIHQRWNEEEKTRMIFRTQRAKEIFGDVPQGPSVPDYRPAPVPAHPLYLPPPENKTSSVSDMAGSIDKSLTLARSWQHLWVVPPGFHRNASFFGMQKEIDVLHARLFKAKKRAENLMAVLICGVPGSGKSHLARQYVWTHREHYPGGIFWVDAKSCQSTYKCLWDIAQAATLTDGQEFQSADAKSSTKYVEAVRNWLQSRDEWLLVFDGISFGNDEEINHFKQFLPFRERCSIIYTSVDKTLRKKQRLYEPYCLLISPLQAEDACKLLFKDLGIKRPTAEQVRKATEVVNHYECLPLAIHAISHRLSATDKPIEKYHIDSHLTDEKLAEPFLSIMHDLYRREHFAALNLINLLSFLGHHVPVGLITLGKSFLDAWNIEIVTSSRHGERGDFDTTLGILIRYGLIERTSDIYPLDPISSSPRLEKCPVDMKTVIPELSESQTESSQEGFFSAYQTSGVSDVIKIHSVVQGFCRDELKILDKELKGRLHLGNSGNTDAGYYDSWLVVATRVFCKSYGNARSRMDRVDDCGLVKDYREYETHASQLIKNFPKKTSYDIVREARDELKQVVKSIRNEIDRISPSSSQESIRKHRSVFDRSSSSSSFPESTTSDGPSRQLTWDFSDVVSSKAESPQEMRMSPHHVNLGPIIPHIYRNASRDKYDGYLTDDEGLKAFTRTSPAMSQISQGTERPRSSQASSPPQQVDDEGWHVVENPSRNKPAKPRKSKSTARFPRHIRDSRPAAPILERTPAEWRSVSDTDKRKAGPLVSASEVLSAVQKASPPPAHASIVRQDRDKENVITYAYVASRFSQDQLNSTKQRSSSSPGGRTRPVFSGGQSRSSVESLHSNVPFSSLSTEFKADPLSQSTYSEPDQGLLQELNALDLRIAPDSRYNGHRISASRRVAPLADMSASTPSILNSLPYDSNIEIQVPRRGKGVSTLALSQTSTNLRSIPHPSAIMPGASPPSSQILDVSTGYASDPALEPMSRGPSGQSHHSWSTEPSRHPPGPSALPSHLQFAGPHHFVPQQQTLSGAGSWVSDLGQYPRQPLLSTSALHVDTSYAGIATKRAIPPLDTNVSNLDPVWDPPTASSVHFGAHRVDLHDARQRLEGYRHQYQLQARQQYQIYHDNRSGPLLAQEPAVWPLQMRARSGSSPSSPGFNGLGLDI